MTDFATILAQLEELSPPVERTRVFRPASLASALDETAAAARPDDTGQSRAGFIASAYGMLSSESRNKTKTAPSKSAARAPRLPDREALLRQLRLAEGSLDDLRSLRRKLAWLCHPDRQDHANGRQSETLMAEFNARIDAAIAKIRRAAVVRNG